MALTVSILLLIIAYFSFRTTIVTVVYFSQYSSHFLDIFYTCYFHFICIFRYVFHSFHYVYLDACGQFPYLILSWLSYCSKPTSPSFYFIFPLFRSHTWEQDKQSYYKGAHRPGQEGTTKKGLSTRRTMSMGPYQSLNLAVIKILLDLDFPPLLLTRPTDSKLSPSLFLVTWRLS